jgi:hypothetical protein
VPAVSVIVPAHNAAATLPATLAALAAQDFTGAREIVVVDDGSADDTAAIAERAGAIVVRHASPRGAAEARNAGAAVARAEVLAFTDSDCEPVPHWLSTGAKLLRDYDFVQGSIAPPPGAAVGPFDRTLWVTAGSGLFESANIFVRAELFRRLGGFRPFQVGAVDEAGRPLRGHMPRPGEGPFGEDVWFGWRARRDGARIAFSEEAVVHHAVFPRGFAGYLRERRRMSYFPALVRTVPELRGAFYLNWFLSRRSAAFDLAAASFAVAAITRRRALLTGVLPYLTTLVPRTGNQTRGAAVHSLKRAPGDAVAAAALVRGSIAARTIVF